MKKFLFLLFVPTFLLAQTNYSTLDAYLDTMYQRKEFMGSILIAKNGKIEFQKSYGFADIQNKIKANHQTQYRVGSITKTFTAVMIMRLIEEKKLSLKTKVSKFFPKIKNASKITIEQLLQHRSGIHSLTDDENILKNMYRGNSKEENISRISNYKSDFKPGTKHEYSNSNYVLLGYIVEKLTGLSYEMALNKYILSVTGIKNTHKDVMIDTKDGDAKSYYYMNNNYQVSDETDPSFPDGAGSITSTTSDLAVFIDMLLNGKIVNMNTVKQMIKMVDGYGLGIYSAPYYDKKFYGHNGRIDASTSAMYYQPEDKIAVVILTNQLSMKLNDLLLEVLNAAYSKEVKIPTAQTFITVDAEKRKLFWGIYELSGFKITISEHQKGLLAQGDGQPSFEILPIDEFTYISESIGAKIQFNNDYTSFTLFQGGQELIFKKKTN